MVINLISSATKSAVFKYVPMPQGNVTFHAIGITSASTGAATVKVQVSNVENNPNSWVDLGTITLAISTLSTSDGFASSAKWEFVRGNITALSGSGASVSLIMGG